MINNECIEYTLASTTVRMKRQEKKGEKNAASVRYRTLGIDRVDLLEIVVVRRSTYSVAFYLFCATFLIRHPFFQMFVIAIQVWSYRSQRCRCWPTTYRRGRHHSRHSQCFSDASQTPSSSRLLSNRRLQLVFRNRIDTIYPLFFRQTKRARR